MPQTETPEQELERLIREQEQDDTPIIWPDIPYAIPLDKAIGDDESLGGVVGVEYDFDGEEEPMLRVYGGRSMHEQVLNADWHGTYTGYQNHGCRCARCKAVANPIIAERTRRWKERKRNAEPWHGTFYKGYQKMRCRCVSCKAAAKRANYGKGPKPEKKKVTCVCGCGKRFLRRRRGHKFATDYCRLRVMRMTPRRPKSMKCMKCGKLFAPRQAKQSYCSKSCRDAAASLRYYYNHKAAA